MTKRVFFIGAGATKADFPAAPTLKDILGKILAGNVDEYTIAKNKIKDFLQKYFFDLSQKTDQEYPLIQDVISFIDTSLKSENPDINRNDFEDIRRTIIYQIGFAIEQNTQVNDSINMWRLTEQLTPEDIVISTNYDIVADNCFLRKFANKMNYGITFRAGIDAVNRRPNSDVAAMSTVGIFSFDEGPSLLKLHGSFNWLFCPRCDELDVTPAQKGALQHGTRCFRRGECTALYEPLIVPPTFFKSYQNRIVRETWQHAENAITNAEEVIFIGYSMPLDDYEIKSMLLRGIAKKQIKPRITVIDKIPQNERENQEKQDCETNYRRVFGTVNYRACGFDSYMRELENPN